MSPGSATEVPSPTATRRIVGFALLLLLYQSAEGVGDHWMHSFAIQAALMVVALIAAWPVARALGWRARSWPDAYALAPRPGAGKWLLSGMLLAVALKLIAVLVGLRLGIYRETGMAAPAAAVLAQMPMLLIGTFVPSLAEDILTRGYLRRAAGIEWPGGAVFVLTSSGLYVLNHIYRLGLGPREWVLLFAYGLTYAIAVWRTGSLWAAVGPHWGWNIGNGLSSAIVPMATVEARGSTLLSIGAHALMLLAVLVATTPRPGHVHAGHA